MSSAILAVGIFLLYGCAKKDPQVDFMPIQIHWSVAAGQSEDNLPNKDVCVIKVTSTLMSEPMVTSSTLSELVYVATYGLSAENPEITEFSGKCQDPTLSAKECKWRATCDKNGQIVVKFNNGD